MATVLLFVSSVATGYAQKRATLRAVGVNQDQDESKNKGLNMCSAYSYFGSLINRTKREGNAQTTGMVHDDGGPPHFSSYKTLALLR